MATLTTHLYDDALSPSPTLSLGHILLDTDFESLNDFVGVTIGVCAMNKKTFSKPMQNILGRISLHEYVRVIMFTDDTIINKPIENWLYCDAFIAFFSKGFPLDKAIKYVELKKPKMVVNDLEMQYSLMDRCKVYDLLKKHDIDMPPHVILRRDSDSDVADVIEVDDDTIEINGHTFHKPFVEKPISAEDHNIYIYFPSDYGGGCQRLFRKVLNRSSSYSTESAIRKDGSYVYEEFMPTDGSDVKVYTVGPDYAHAEARKSPALDGRVDRDDEGKEKRYPVILTAKEKLIARNVCLAFKQTVCGFDLLRANGNSYVCDVNGFSFVKTSEKYYDDCSQILLEMILSKVAPQHIPEIPPTVEHLAPEVPVPILSSSQLELRCVIGIIRHGDRTPKQKMKMVVKHHDFLKLFEDLGGYKKGHLKIKKPRDLQKVLDIARKLLEHVETQKETELEEEVHKLQQLKSVLEMYGHFSGINRKVQFKLLHKDLDGRPLPGPSLLLILKWGGEVTPVGQGHAEELGKAFRCMYPGGVGEYSSLPGSGFLRLHSTYRHDLKVYASDEGRVQLTAAAFTKGLLDLEGNLASILVQLVRRDQSATMMLDTSTEASELLHDVKKSLHHYLQSMSDFDDSTVKKLAPTLSPSLCTAMKNVKNPYKACVILHEKIGLLLKDLTDLANSEPELIFYHGETIELMIGRWSKLFKDFLTKNGKYDISKIPDIYDCIKYDLQHNKEAFLHSGVEVYKNVLYLADIVISQEYGITIEEKLEISKKTCTLLLRKIRSDLRHTYGDANSDFLHRLDPKKSRGVISPNRSVRTRLYFTSESHIHSLVNYLKYGDLLTSNSEFNPRKVLDSYPELNYLSQVVFMVFEDMSKSADSSRYIVKIYFSPGVKSRDSLLNERTVTDIPPTKITKSRKISLDISASSHTRVIRRRTVPNIEPVSKVSSEIELASENDPPTPINARKSSLETVYNSGGFLNLVSVLDPLLHISTVPLDQLFANLISTSLDDSIDRKLSL